MPERLLLDSHSLLWSLQGTQRLKAETHQAILDPDNEVFVSVVAVWELAIKRASGKLQAPENLEASVTGQGYANLPVTFQHAEIAANLPLHHRDPFDRMLIAQAQAEGLTLVTDDSQIPLYQIPIMPAR